MDQADPSGGDCVSGNKISASRLAQIAASLNNSLAPTINTDSATVEPIRIERVHKASVTILSPVTKSPDRSEIEQEAHMANPETQILTDPKLKEGPELVPVESRTNQEEPATHAGRTEVSSELTIEVGVQHVQVEHNTEIPALSKIVMNDHQAEIPVEQMAQITEAATSIPNVREGHLSEEFVSLGGENPLQVEPTTVVAESPTKATNAQPESVSVEPAICGESQLPKVLPTLEQANAVDKEQIDIKIPHDVESVVDTSGKTHEQLQPASHQVFPVSECIPKVEGQNKITVLEDQPLAISRLVQEMVPILKEEIPVSANLTENNASLGQVEVRELEKIPIIEPITTEIGVKVDLEIVEGTHVEQSQSDNQELAHGTIGALASNDLTEINPPVVQEQKIEELSKLGAHSEGSKTIAPQANVERVSLPSTSSQGDSPSEAVDLTPAQDKAVVPIIESGSDLISASDQPARNSDRVENFTVATPDREYGSEITDRLPTEMVGEQMPWLPGEPLSIHLSHQASTQIAYGLSSQTTVMPQRFEDIVQLSSPESHRTDRPMLLQMKKGEGPFSRSRASSPGEAGPAQSVIPSQERCEEMGPRAWQSETGSENNDHRTPRHQKSLLIIQEAPERSSARQSLALSHTAMDPLNPVPPVAPIKPNAHLCEGMAVSSLSGTKSQSVSVAEVEIKPKASPTKGPNPKDTYNARSKLKKASDNVEPAYENVSSSSEAGQKKPRDKESTQQNQGPIEVDGVRLPDTVTELSSSSVVTIPGKPSSDLLVSLKIPESKLPKGSTTSAGEQKDGHKKSGKRKKPVSSVNDPADGTGNTGNGRNGEEAESLDLNRKFSKLSAKVRNLKKELKEAKETLAGYEKVDPEQEAYERRKRLEKEDQERGNRKLSVLQIIKDMGSGEDPAEAAEKSAKKSDRPHFQSGSSSTAQRAHVIADHTVPPAEVHRGGWTSRDRQDESKNRKKEVTPKAETLKIVESTFLGETQPVVSRPALKTEQNLKNLQNSHSKKMFKDEDEEDSVKKLGTTSQGRLNRQEKNHSPSKHSSKLVPGQGSEKYKKPAEDLKKQHGSSKDEPRVMRPSVTLHDSNSQEQEERPRARRQGKPSPPQPKLVKEPLPSRLEDEEAGHSNQGGRRDSAKDSRRPEEHLGKRETARKRRGQSADSSSSSDTQDKIKHTLRRYETKTKHRS